MEEPFESAGEYEKMLNRGIGLSGHDRFYFIEGRVNNLIEQLPPNFSPQTILDFGCGIGDTAQYFYKKYPDSLIVGTDISEKSLKYAQERYTNDQVKFTHLENLALTNYFDLCYTNGVFHHIISEKRKDVLRKIYSFLKKDAWLSFFENNPFNVATRIVMKRIPFDKDAKMLSHIRAKKLLLETHFSRINSVRFLFYFPQFLSFMRLFEQYLASIPLGTQYHILARK